MIRSDHEKNYFFIAPNQFSTHGLIDNIEGCRERYRWRSHYYVIDDKDKM